MKRQLTAAAVKDYVDAPPAVRKAFDKQAKLRVENFRHPPLRAKKYDESRNIWQARVNRDWRFYFVITGDTYLNFEHHLPPQITASAYLPVGLSGQDKPTANQKPMRAVAVIPAQAGIYTLSAHGMDPRRRGGDVGATLVVARRSGGHEARPYITRPAARRLNMAR